VSGRPFLTYLLDQLEDAGIRHVTLCIGHMGEQITATLGAAYRGIGLKYSQESSPLGTGGALRLALPLLDTETVLVLNGDSFCGVDLGALWRWHAERAAAATVVLTEVDDAARYGTVSSTPDCRITAFVEKGTGHRAGWINAGVYVIACDRLETIPPGRPISLEREMLPRWIEQGVCGYRAAPGTRFLDIGIPEAYAEAERFFGRRAGYG
jgi:NDP-sugar pyrophosphorylase family protein